MSDEERDPPPPSAGSRDRASASQGSTDSARSIERAERLAALLEGRLEARERDKLVASLSSSDAGIEALAEATLILRKQKGTIGAAPRGSATTGGRSRWMRYRGYVLVLAAVVTGVAVWPSVARLVGGGDAATSTSYGALVAARGLAMPPGWTEPTWRRTRGDAEALSARARAVRLGVRLTTLEVALRTDDERAIGLAHGLEPLLDAMPASGPVVALFRRISTESRSAPRQALADLAQGRAAVGELTEAVALDAGSWIEAARLAAAGRNRDFLASSASREALASMERLPGLDASVVRQVRDVRIAADAAEPAWGALSAALDSLASALEGSGR